MPIVRRGSEESMKRALPLTLTVAGLVLYSGGPVASATSTQQGPSAHLPYCVATAVPIGSSQPVVMRCYRTFAESIKAATGGLVRLPASARPGSVTPDQVNSAIHAAKSPKATYVIGIDFQNVNFGGQSVTFIESAKCGYYQISSMPSGWNDIVSSVSTSSGCATTLWQNVGFTGSTFSVGRNSSASGMGSFNDQASSQKWCPSKPC
jgi:hypothetical protein